MGVFSGKGNEEKGKELRERAGKEAERSQTQQWHPTEGLAAANEEDRLFRAARDAQYGADGDAESES